MAKIDINIDDSILREAEKILNSLGMNTEIAVSIFLRRVVLEKRFPVKLDVPLIDQPELVSSPNLGNTVGHHTSRIARKYSKINADMIEEIWQMFLKYLDEPDEINRMSTQVSRKTGMNPSSAIIYMYFLVNLVKGNQNIRIMKMKDLEYYLEKIKHELGESSYQKALESLRLSVPYWKKVIPGRFADKVEVYVNKHE